MWKIPLRVFGVVRPVGSVHAIEYENAVRTNRVFHVSLVSRGKAAFVCAPLCRSSTNTTKAPVPAFRVLQIHAKSAKSIMQFLSVLRNKLKKSFATTSEAEHTFVSLAVVCPDAATFLNISLHRVYLRFFALFSAAAKTVLAPSREKSTHNQFVFCLASPWCVENLAMEKRAFVCTYTINVLPIVVI